MKTVVITGASRGIGKAIAEKFAKENFNLVSCGRDEIELNSTKNKLLKINSSIDVLAIPTDVSKKNDRESFCKKIAEHFKTIDALINNAGIFLPGNVTDEPEERLEILLQTNLISAYEITRKLLPLLLNNKSAHIFNMSSVAGLKAYNNGGSYSISKFALTGFSKNLREELMHKNIRVTTIYPGAVLTDAWKGVDLPKERFILPEDVANAIFNAYQLSDSSTIDDLIIRPTQGDI